MKLHRSTLILIAIALGLGGVVLVTQTRQSNRPNSAQEETAAGPLYAFEEADVVGLKIETQGQAVAFERDGAGFWQMTVPEAHPAEEAAIAFLLSRLTTNGLLRTTTIDAADQEEFGLDVPQATVELILQDGETHTLVLGDADFSGQAYYALIDPAQIPLAKDAGEVSVAIVPVDVINGVDRPLEEWQAVVDSAPTDTPPEAFPADNSALEATDDAPDPDVPARDLPIPETAPIPTPTPETSDTP